MKYAMAFWDDYYDAPISGMLMGGFWFHRDFTSDDVRLYLPTIKDTTYLIERHLSFERNVSAQGCLHLPPDQRIVHDEADWQQFYAEWDIDEFTRIHKGVVKNRYVETVPSSFIHDPFVGSHPEVQIR